MTNDNPLTTEEAADYLGISADTMRRTLKHEIPHRQRSVRAPMYFHKQDLDRWDAAHMKQPIR